MSAFGAVTTDYVYDGTMLVREMQTVGGVLTPSATYFQGPGGPAYRRSDAGTGQPSWYVYDGLGSVVGEVDALGDLTSSQPFDVYGAPRLTNTGTPGVHTTRQGYVGALGHMTDPETAGLIYMRARYYDPAVGKFESEDPECSGGNWFVYAGNDPSNKVDATGKFPLGPNGNWVEPDFTDEIYEIYEILEDLDKFTPTGIQGLVWTGIVVGIGAAGNAIANAVAVIKGLLSEGSADAETVDEAEYASEAAKGVADAEAAAGEGVVVVEESDETAE